MSRQFLATEATLFLSGGSSDGLQPRKVQVMPASDWLIPSNTHFSLAQWSDQQQPRMTSALPMTPPVKPQMRNAEAEVPRTPVASDTVTSDIIRCQPPVTPVQTRPSVTSLDTPDKASPSLHPDILAVLSWQNEQLSALQVVINVSVILVTIVIILSGPSCQTPGGFSGEQI